VAPLIHNITVGGRETSGFLIRGKESIIPIW